MRHWNPEAHIGDDKYILAPVLPAVAEATAGKTDEQEMHRVERVNRDGGGTASRQRGQTSPPGQKWAASLVVSRVRAAGIEEDEKDMRKRVTRGRPDAKVRKLMAASSTAQPPGVVKTLTDDKKRKRPVKKRRGKKLTVAESEAESEAQAQAEAEAEAARSSKRRVPRARKNKNKE
eukprot:jgi/Tetstr1/432093/TSEL_021564.t1